MERKRSGLKELNCDLMEMLILYFLAPREALALERTCKHFHRLFRLRKIWPKIQIIYLLRGQGQGLLLPTLGFIYSAYFGQSFSFSHRQNLSSFALQNSKWIFILKGLRIFLREPFEYDKYQLLFFFFFSV